MGEPPGVGHLPSARVHLVGEHGEHHLASAFVVGDENAQCGVGVVGRRPPFGHDVVPGVRPCRVDEAFAVSEVAQHRLDRDVGSFGDGGQRDRERPLGHEGVDGGLDDRVAGRVFGLLTCAHVVLARFHVHSNVHRIHF